MKVYVEIKGHKALGPDNTHRIRDDNMKEFKERKGWNVYT